VAVLAVAESHSSHLQYLLVSSIRLQLEQQLDKRQLEELLPLAI
jgi:hypothetical protein